MINKPTIGMIVKVNDECNSPEKYKGSIGTIVEVSESGYFKIELNDNSKITQIHEPTCVDEITFEFISIHKLGAWTGLLINDIIDYQTSRRGHFYELQITRETGKTETITMYDKDALHNAIQQLDTAFIGPTILVERNEWHQPPSLKGLRGKISERSGVLVFTSPDKLEVGDRIKIDSIYYYIFNMIHNTNGRTDYYLNEKY
ncbi:hypothetical protein M0R19_05050 [Candidatus Pacearchaeota archaeon]|nr:hypothetical protein [Candidatus Pacearchaeota archaeon]